MELLLGSGLSTREVDLYGQTPLFYAASENRLNLIHFFNNQGNPDRDADDINKVDKLALQTPLYYAARKGHLEMCKLLIEKGADLTHLDSNGKMAIEYAKKAKFMDVADYLGAELKKIREQSRVGNSHNQSPEESNAAERLKKKKDESIVNVNRNINKQAFKIVYMNEKGETRDLSEEEVRNLVKDKPILESYLANPDNIPNDALEASKE